MKYLIIFTLLLTSCVPKPDVGIGPFERGQQLYQVHCTSCHATDPKRDSLGPALAGSSKALVQTKLLTGGYPEGYSPKRPTMNMPLFRLTPAEVDAIGTYLELCY